MPWKQNYTVSDERSLQDVKWPEGAACAVMLVIDAAPPCGPAGIGAAEWDSDAGRYARDVALPRLLDLLEQHGMHATFPVPAVFAEKEPALARRLRERGHEVAAHGWRREDVSGLQRHEETWRIARTTEILAQVLGERPAAGIRCRARATAFRAAPSPRTRWSCCWRRATAISATARPTTSRITG